MTVRADQRIWVVERPPFTVFARFGFMHTTCQILQVDLVNDAKTRWHHAKRVKCLHAPLHELVALLVALKFQLHVQIQRLLGAKVINHDGVINHQIDWHQWLNGLGLFTQRCSHTAHGCQVGKQRHSREILQYHARDNKRNLFGTRCIRAPVCQLLHVQRQHLLAITIAQHRLQHNAQRHRQAPHIRIPLGQGWQREELSLCS